MTLVESELWIAGWRPVSEKCPRKQWIDPETEAIHERDEAHKIYVKRNLPAPVPPGEGREG